MNYGDPTTGPGVGTAYHDCLALHAAVRKRPLMRTTLLAALSALGPALLSAQAKDPISLPVGSPLVDGRIYKAHEATAMRSLTRDGSIVRSIRYTNFTYMTRWKGLDVCVVESKPNIETGDTAFYEKTVLDARSMAILHREERDGGGRLVNADIDGAHVTGQYRAKAGDPVQPLDFTLETPSYYAPFVDAAIGATHMQLGQSWRVPSFSFTPGRQKTTWETYRITGREPAGGAGGTSPAWVVENADDAPVHTKIWITDDPPYLPRVVTTLPDGSIARFESTLIRLTQRAADTVTLYPNRADGVDTHAFAPHLVAAEQAVTKGDSLLRASKWTNDWSVTESNGTPFIRLRIDTYPGDANDFHADILFDRRTTGIVHGRQDFSTGRTLDFDIDGAHVTGLSRPATDSSLQPVDFVLDAPSFLASVVDFTVSSVPHWDHVVVRVPIFDLGKSQRKTQWATYRMTGTDTIRVGGHIVHARVVEGEGTTRDKLWLIDEPPYVPLWVRYFPDGSVATLKQALVRLHS
jgi:hypothetical protein